MSRQIKGDDPANPVTYTIPAGQDASGVHVPEIQVTFSGLTIRQEFAARAMQGLLASKTHLQEELHEKCSKAGISIESLFAAMSTGFADALIAELNKEA